MPHIKDEQKQKVHSTSTPEKEGDLCFLFSEAALVEYNKNPRWSSIHQIRKALRNPYHTEWSHAVVVQYMGMYTRQDIETAADLAFFEFYRIVGASYEDGMIQQNGNCFKGAKIPSLREGTVIGVLGVETPMTEEELAITGAKEVVLTPAQLQFQTPEPKPIVVPDAHGDLTLAQVAPSEPVAKKRGRPFGSKNKVKEVA